MLIAYSSYEPISSALVIASDQASIFYSKTDRRASRATLLTVAAAIV
jgi:hypothetical protein